MLEIAQAEGGDKRMEVVCRGGFTVGRGVGVTLLVGTARMRAQGW